MKNLLVLLIVTCSSVYGQPDSVYAKPDYDKGRIYMSVDRGVNWTRADIGLPLDAVVNAWTTTDGLVIMGTDRHGVYISSDRMKSWHSSSRGLPTNARIMSVATGGNSILVGTYLHGLFYSDDRGRSWQPASKGLTNPNIRVLYHLNGVLFAGTDAGLFISHDEGTSWRLSLKGPQINSITSEGNELFVATNKGVLRTNNFGESWSWIFSQGAFSSITSNSTDLYMKDFFGKVYKAAKENYVLIKADIFLPFHYTFRITPGGNQFFTIDWNKALMNIDGISEIFWADGIPDNVPIKYLLDTPFGVLAAVGNDGC
jgi:ligand-binding sensor domain-containing protein